MSSVLDSKSIICSVLRVFLHQVRFATSQPASRLILLRDSPYRHPGNCCRGIMALVLTLQLFGAISRLQGSTYFVDPAGSDSNAGGSSSPWQTVWHAMPLLSAGDTLTIRPGVYPMTVHNINTGASGTPASPITVNGMPGSILTGSGIYVGHSNWVFNAVTISNYVSSAHMLGGFVLGKNAHNTVIENCTLTTFLIDQSQYGVVWFPDPTVLGPNTNVIATSLANNCVVSNNTFYNFMGAETIRVGGSNNLICNNWIEKQMNGDIFQFFGCSNVIRGNFITNCYYRLDVGGGQHADMFQTYGQDGNVVSSGDPYFESYGNIAERNQFWDCYISFGQMTDDSYGTGGYVPKVSDFTLRNNLFVRCGGQDAYAGGAGGSISSIGIAGYRFINNTLVNCYKDVNASGYVVDLVFHSYPNNVGGMLGAATNAVIVNNAFINCGYNSNVAFVGFENGYGFNTNLWNMTIRSNYCSWWNGSKWTKVNSNWQVNIKNTPGNNDTYAPPPDINNGDDPKLVAITQTNAWPQLRPMLGSPLIDTGTNVSSYGVTGDFELQSRSLGAGTDIGFLEFDPNLLLHLDFDEDFSSQVYDVTGYGHHAVNLNGANWIKRGPGKIGSAGVWTMIGTNSSGYLYSQYGAITNVTALDFITNGTISVWVCWASNAVNGVVGRGASILDGGDPPATAAPSYSQATNSWALCYGKPFSENSTPGDSQYAVPTGPVFKNWGRSTTNDINNPNNLMLWQDYNGHGEPRDNTTWYHIAVTWTGNGSVIGYANGVPFATNSLGSPWLRINGNTYPKWLTLGAAQHGVTYGGGTYPNDRFFAGSMDDVRIYGRSLSATEVGNLYALGNGGSGSVVVVNQPPSPPSVSISVSPSSITGGQAATLSWTSVNATNATLSGIGQVALNGNVSVSPAATTTYTLSAFGAGGSAATNVTVTVTNYVTSSLTFLPADGTITSPFALGSGYFSQNTQTTVVSDGGRAAFNFTLASAGEYGLVVNLNAPNESSNSLYVNLDAEPVDPTMIWDIPVTSGFQQRLASWRGNGTSSQSQFVPVYFNLGPGPHQLIIRGRESGVQVGQISLVQRPSAPVARPLAPQ